MSDVGTFCAESAPVHGERLHEAGAGVRSDAGTSFAQLLFGGDTGLTEEEVADSAAKVDTWRVLPARARPKLAHLIVDMVDRATGHEDCTASSSEECLACQQRLHAWQELDYIFQLTARNVESSGPRDSNQTGPKVDEIITSRIIRAQKQGWKALVEEYHGDAALRRKQDLDQGQPEPTQRILGEPASQQDADAFCRNAKSMQLTTAAACLTAPPVLPDSARLREKLREKIRPIEVEKAEALTRLRHRRLEEMQKKITPKMIQDLDEALAKRASKLKPFKKKGRTGWRNEYIKQLHETPAGPALRRLAIQFLIGKAPLEVYKRYGHVSLGPRDKNGRGPEDPRPVGSPEPFWR